MKTNRILLLVCICMLCALTACSVTENGQDTVTQDVVSQKTADSSEEQGLKLVTPVDSSGVGAGNEAGYYDIMYHNVGANITYTDYATHQCVYLSSQLSSTHRDETDPSWISSADGGIEPFLSGGKLYLRIIGMPTDSDAPGTPGRILEMDLDGSNRKELFSLKSGETFVQNAIASNGKTFYAMINRVRPADVMWKRSLVRIDAASGAEETLLDFDLPIYIVGASQNKLFLKTIEIPPLEELFDPEKNSQAMAAQRHTLYEFDTDTNDLRQVKQWKQNELIGSCDEDEFYYLDFSDFSVYGLNITTGKKEKICDSFPACDPDHTNLLSLADQHLQIETVDLSNAKPDGSQIKRTQYAVDLESGEVIEQTLFVQEEGGMPDVCHIMAQTEEFFLVHYATTSKTVSAVGQDGKAVQEELVFPQNALIKKSDYWANIPAFIPIEEKF